MKRHACATLGLLALLACSSAESPGGNEDRGGNGGGGWAGTPDAGVAAPAMVLPQKVGSFSRLAFEPGGRVVKFAHGNTNVLTERR